MHTTFAVVLYDPKLPYGREIVGAFDTKSRATARVQEFPGQDVKILCREPPAYGPNLQDLHRVFDRTDFEDRERPSKMQDGLELRRHGRLIGYWPGSRPGTGTDGRVIPHDLRLWVAECLWVEANGKREMPRIFGTITSHKVVSPVAN